MITQTAALRLINGKVTTSRDITTTIRKDACTLYTGTQVFTTSHTALVIQSADVAAGGFSQQGILVLCNLDDTHNALVGVDDAATFRSLAVLFPGEVAMLAVKTGEQLHCKSSAGTIVLEHTAVER